MIKIQNVYYMLSYAFQNLNEVEAKKYSAEKFEFIDIFYANAGYPYYEEMNYVDWDRVQRMFETNVFSPISVTLSPITTLVKLLQL